MGAAKEILRTIKSNFILAKTKANHRKKNRHNYTTLNKGTTNNVTIGRYTYGNLNCIDYNDGCKLYIGDFCSIANEVVFLMGGNHSYDTFSLYPFIAKFDNTICSYSKGDIIVEDDVWIGYGSMILSGVKIGRGSIVAAGSIVTKDVPPYSIVAGIPAKFIKKRFSEKIIDKLLEIDYSRIDEKIYKEYNEIFNTILTDENVFDIVDKLNGR